VHRLALAFLVFAAPASGLANPILLPKFEDSVVVTGLTTPVAVRFDVNGNIFVAEKAGRVKLFNPLPSPGAGVVVLDIRTQVMNYGDRGLLGLALHPRYPDVPYVYVLYTYDAPPGGVAPVWNDACADPIAPRAGCVVSGRLVRYTMTAGQLTDATILIQNEWYQQYPSHSIGDLAFGPDGYLYLSAGDGASDSFADFGTSTQRHMTYPNPGDPLDEGGALRSQDLLTSGDPVELNGSILRVDPATGEAAAGNPLPGLRHIAFGLRNPFRIGFRPGTSELWIGDVGWKVWEEVNRIADIGDATVENFGWPCYEGDGPHPDYDQEPMCAALIDDTLPAGTPGQKTVPVFAYRHGQAPGYLETVSPCKNGTSGAISGIAFYQGGEYPIRYNGALFFADYAVKCIYAMRAGDDGVPDPTQIDVLERDAELPVALQVGPGGDIYYVAILEGNIRRIRYTGMAPTATATADVTGGLAPLAVHFDGSASVDPDGEPLAYAWDLDGDGQFDDSAEPMPEHTYGPGTYRVRLQVTDVDGKTAVSAPIQIAASDTPPVATITAPLAGSTWITGQEIVFAATAVDLQDGVLPPEAMKWRVVLYHCPSGGCHPHPQGDYEGVAGGSFLAAPDGYPAYYDIELTVTDSGGLTDVETVRIDAVGTTLSFATQPAGLTLLYAGSDLATPASVTEVVGYVVTIEALSPQELGGGSYLFTGWSDDGARVHDIAAPGAAMTYVASFEIDTDRDGVVDSADPCPTLPGASCPPDAGPGGGGCGCAVGSPDAAPIAIWLVALFARWLRARRRSSTPAERTLI